MEKENKATNTGNDAKPKVVNNKEKKKSAASKIEKFKRQYFEYYDDIKDYTKGKEDW